MLKKETIEEKFRTIQENICKGLEETDGSGTFKEDTWKREGGGGGRSRVMENGTIIEKGGVNFSAVHGITSPKLQETLEVPEAEFFATGVSIVLHPHHPLIPIIHMNIRYFEVSNGTWWFGGGIDLTPHYVEREEAQQFHLALKQICDKYHNEYYPRFKQWADDYFYIAHREETRGIGGIFFDKLSGQSEPLGPEELFSFVTELGDEFVDIYRPFVKANHTKSVSEREKKWQQIRRSRYVEFNLVYDRGTRFGLDSGGRTESILMSLPPQANWYYNYIPDKGTPESETQKLLQKNIDWINII